MDIFLTELFYISTQISLKFVAKGPVDKNPALVKWWLPPNRQKAISWTGDGPAYMHHQNLKSEILTIIEIYSKPKPSKISTIIPSIFRKIRNTLNTLLMSSGFGGLTDKTYCKILAHMA